MKDVIAQVAAASRRPRTTVMRGDVRFVVVHHSVTPITYKWEQILSIHLHKGYQSIGYHYVICGANGEIFKCLPVGPPPVVGAHVKNENSYAVGICITGNYEEQFPKTLAISALCRLWRELRGAFPKAKLVGHREMKKSRTKCPGKYLQRIVERIQQGKQL